MPIEILKTNKQKNKFIHEIMILVFVFNFAVVKDKIPKLYTILGIYSCEKSLF